MSEPGYSGGCFCGSVRYRATGRATSECFCHCESCRRAAGATPVAWATFQEATFTISDSLAIYASSAQVRRGFCRACGSSLTYQHAARPGEIDVALVTLDPGSGLVPKRHIWVQDKPTWEVIGDGLPQFASVVGE